MFNGAISFVGGRPSNQNIREAIRLAERLRGQKEAAGMDHALRGYDLPDGTQVYVVDLGESWTIQIIPPVAPPDWPVHTPDWPEPPISEPLPIIGVISGATMTGGGSLEEVEIYEEGEREPRIVEIFQVANPLWNMRLVTGGGVRPRSAELFEPNDAAQKIGVEAGKIPVALENRTQLHTHEASKFTGAMVPLVQLLLGVGRILDRDYEDRFFEQVMPDPDVVHPIIKETLMLGQVETDIREIRSVTKYMSSENREHEFYHTELPVEFDFRWNRTHGITWASRSASQHHPDILMMADPSRTIEPFLVEVGQRGIFAMPLPRDIASFYPRVRQQYFDVYPELQQYTPFRDKTLFDALGGFPTGVGIPSSTDELDRYIRAGLVLDSGVELTDFYAEDNTAFCTGHGWSFSSDGRKAINVARVWEGSMQYGACYEVYLDVRQRSGIEFNAQYPMVIQRLGLTDFVDVYKAYRLTEEQVQYIFSPLLRGNHRSEYQTFDELEVEPDWEFRVSYVLLRKGSTSGYGPGCEELAEWGYPCSAILGHQQYKVFEPVLNAYITSSFRVPSINWYGGQPWFSADGPIFATYVRDSPEILCFYTEEPTTTEPVGSTRGECQYTGSWDEDYRTRSAGVSGNFYTTSRDFRRWHDVVGGTITRYTATYAGWADIASNTPFQSTGVHTSRHNYFKADWHKEYIRNRERAVAIICAANNRSVFFACDRIRTYGRIVSEGSDGIGNIGVSGINYGIIRSFVHHYWTYTGVPMATSCHWRQYDSKVPDGCASRYGGMPSGFFYSACNANGGTTGFIWDFPFTYTSSAGGLISGGNHVYKGTKRTLGDGAFSRELEHYEYEVEYKVYGFGLPEMNNRVLSEGDTDPDIQWWMCALPIICEVNPWVVVKNTYGIPFTFTDNDVLIGERIFWGRVPGFLGSGYHLGRYLFGVIDE